MTEALRPTELSAIEALTTTRAIRRYTDEPVPDAVLRDILFAATRAPSGSNRQPFRFVVLTDGPNAAAVKDLLAEGARTLWSGKVERDGFARGSGAVAGSPKARMAASMDEWVASIPHVPVVVLPCLNRYRDPEPSEGANVYPACQNLLVAARAYGYGGVMTMIHRSVEPQLRELLGIPDGTAVCATITLGRPAGHHGPVRRRPLDELVYADGWEQPAPWALDPPGTRFTAAGPPKP